jgi:hypothetical protein
MPGIKVGLTAVLTATQHTLASEKGVYGRHNLLLHIRDHVGVDVQREPDAAMS